MKQNTSAICWTIVLLACMTTAVHSWDYSQPLIIDHNFTDLGLIPAERIDSVQANQKFHYAHTSHGAQLTSGIRDIAQSNALYQISIGARFLPDTPEAFCVFDGQEDISYVTPEEYWATSTGLNKTRSVLDNNPSINASMWCWCGEIDEYTEAELQAYLDAISLLESEYPDVVFIYMTQHAQTGDWFGYNRYLRNEQIRAFCRDNNKVLYDFADLDCWWYNPATLEWEYSTYEYDGHIVPIEHPSFHGTECYHTSDESCLQKGKAFWWLVSLLEGGGQGDTLSVHETSWGEVKSLYR
ncbi:MAG TPA: hypothetical protein ENO08_02780 [Candidatus Eisenbacteria bacterium]|uniref:SGNH/GDSL hydrolase family protein n=1 Tax=Eiseniibacteriota bacterium TaxID=2212470 RepID=A0A7V2F321_UNCEI|nr:hypothetical protein [Candidatus Eisenbacteria bacterium]